jgi:hypothetical protein
MTVTKRDKAKQFAGHYFRLLGKHAGSKWNWENDAEIRQLVDYLIDAAKEEMQQEESKVINYVCPICGEAGEYEETE